MYKTLNPDNISGPLHLSLFTTYKINEQKLNTDNTFGLFPFSLRQKYLKQTTLHRKYVRINYILCPFMTNKFLEYNLNTHNILGLFSLWLRRKNLRN